MERVRIIYSKSKDAIYFEEKDLICIFENSLKRAGVEISYINGMPSFVFAYPLPVGIESVYEIVDIYTQDMVPISYFIKELNKMLPPGITCLFASYINLDDKSIESSVFASVYVINFVYSEDMLKDMTNAEIKAMKDTNTNKFKAFLDQEEIVINKDEDVNIKPFIQDYSILIDGSFEITVDTGERSNLEINDVMTEFKSFLGRDIDYNIKRTKMLYK